MGTPNGHGLQQHAHIKGIWVVVSNDLVDIVRSSSGIGVAGSVHECYFVPSLLDIRESGSSAKVASTDDENMRHVVLGMVNTVDSPVDGHDRQCGEGYVVQASMPRM